MRSAHGWHANAETDPDPCQRRTRLVSAEQIAHEVVSGHPKMLAHRPQERTEGSRTEGFVGGDRDVMGAVCSLPGEAKMGTRLTGHDVPMAREGVREVGPRHVPGEPHAANTSSRM